MFHSKVIPTTTFHYLCNIIVYGSSPISWKCHGKQNPQSADIWCHSHYEFAINRNQLQDKCSAAIKSTRVTQVQNHNTHLLAALLLEVPSTFFHDQTLLPAKKIRKTHNYKHKHLSTRGVHTLLWLRGFNRREREREAALQSILSVESPWLMLAAYRTRQAVLQYQPNYWRPPCPSVRSIVGKAAFAYRIHEVDRYLRLGEGELD